ncbi:MAG: NAD(+)/NADH kinase [Anaerolineales bacterium]|nr:NAD(+)/NADH kinase [Anaerolineales bacterium]
MPDHSLPPRSIAVMANPQVGEAYQQAQEVTAALQSHGATVSCGMLNDEDLRAQVMDGGFDLLIALGGDGTMLRAGHLCAPVQVPILGINMGRFGFLTEVELDEWRAALPRLLQGEYRLEKRMMISASQWRNGQRLGDWEVLNEIVVSRGHLVHPVHLEASVDGRFLSTFVADALIAATPTGSTAYALAAGGPILPPELRNILLVAVAPHLSIDRAIVLAEGSTVNITVVTDHQAVLSPDGQPPLDLETGDQITACASEHSALFVRFQDPGYFYRNLTPHMSQNPSTGNHR